jgi:hypothetical protein
MAINFKIAAFKQLGQLFGVPLSDTPGNVLTENAPGTLPSFKPVSGSVPAGADTEVQFNDGGAFGGDPSFLFTKTNKLLAINRLALTAPDDSHALVKFNQTNAPGQQPSIFMDNDGTWHLFSTDFASSFKLNSDDTWQFDGEFSQPINYAAPANIARIAQLRGIDFLSANDDGPGTDDSSPPRFFVISSKPATALAPVASVSFALDGRFWDGAASIQKAIEFGNVVRTTGNPQIWLQQISGGTGHPFMRMFWDQGVTGVISTHELDTYKVSLRAWDVNDAVDREFIALTAGNTPNCKISQPTGGSLIFIPPTSSPGVSGALWNNAGTLTLVP